MSVSVTRCTSSSGNNMSRLLFLLASWRNSIKTKLFFGFYSVDTPISVCYVWEFIFRLRCQRRLNSHVKGLDGSTKLGHAISLCLSVAPLVRYTDGPTPSRIRVGLRLKRFDTVLFQLPTKGMSNQVSSLSHGLIKSLLPIWRSFSTAMNVRSEDLGRRDRQFGWPTTGSITAATSTTAMYYCWLAFVLQALELQP